MMAVPADRVALVTGAARGIGRAIALRLAVDGFALAILDADAEGARVAAAELASLGHRSAAFGCDVADFVAVSDAVAEAAATLGVVEVLVNNAGISPKHAGVRAPADAMDPAEWRRVVDVNLTGCFNLVRAVAPAMKARGRGVIVNMASVAGRAYFPHVGVHYATTKAALVGFTRHLAGEFGPAGITVNAVAPGRIDTPMMRGLDPALNEAVRRETPLGRFGAPEDVAEAVSWLASPRATFVTGQVIDVAGGWLMT
jgi:3-oxoacyl-[acyl-carrier protein] reductase